MAWYRQGTISLTNGSTTVTGVSTEWIANAQIGEGLIAPDGKIYEIANIASNTSLTLASGYLGSNASGQTYTIAPTHGYIRDLATQAASLVNSYSDIASGPGAGKFANGTAALPGITFAEDLDTGLFRSAANTLNLVAGGAVKAAVTSTGLAVTGSVTSTVAAPVTATTLTTTGNVTLGDAATDTVQVNGYMGVGSAGGSTIGVFVSNNALTSATQVGVYSTPTGTSAALSAIRGFTSQPQTASAGFTCADVIGYNARNAIKGAGSTITNAHGLYIDDQTQGTNNYGITSLVSSGTNKWNIYASGTAANYFAGNVGIGTSSPAQLLTVSAAATPTLRLNNSSTSIAASGVSLGRIEMFSNDASVGGTNVAAYIEALSASEFTGGGNVSSLVFGTAGVGAGVIAERLRIDPSGNTLQTQPAPAAVNATATLTVANLRTRIITSTTAALVTGTLPTGTLMDSDLYSAATDMGYDWSVINTGGSNNFVVAAGTGHTVVGNMTVSPNTTSMFRSRRTAANTWITYRIG